LTLNRTMRGLSSTPAEYLDDGQGGLNCPYFDAHSMSENLSEMITLHLNCKKHNGNRSANPYLQRLGFHITFFERIDAEKPALSGSLWQVRNLFEENLSKTSKDPERCFRRSALTVSTLNTWIQLNALIANFIKVYARSTVRYMSADGRYGMHEGLEPLYTILLPLPEVFEEPSDKIESHVIQQHTRVMAEVASISMGLSHVIDKWTELDEYLADLLKEEFMHPKKCSQQLFDTEDFSRSRKYFWMIRCLGEFELSIADSIKQLDLYREARIDPLFRIGNLEEFLDAVSVIPNPFKERELEYPNDPRKHSSQEVGAKVRKDLEDLVREITNQRESLVDLQTEFQRKLDTVKALRDEVSYLTKRLIL
jgi:hypothetical protein